MEREKSQHCCWPLYRYEPGDVVEIVSSSGKRRVWRVVGGWRHWARGWTIVAARRQTCATESLKPTPCFMRRRPCSAIPNCRSRSEWAHTQSIFQALRIWELVKLRRVLCLRRGRMECWADHMKRTGVIVARQLKKHNLACKLWQFDVCALLLGRW